MSKSKLYASPDRQIEGCETQLVSKEGRVIDIRLSAKLIVREGGEFGSIGFFHDLTERKQLEAKLKHISLTDSLTGLHNQRHFFAVLEAEMERAKRYRQPLSLICIDLDNFKQVNDVLGHLEGDNALRFTAQIIGKELRKTDMAFRYGGDEFMVLLPETCYEEAEAIKQRLQVSFDRGWAGEWHPKRGCPVVSISMGIAQFDQHESPETLMRRADKLMYGAKKRSGRLTRLFFQYRSHAMAYVGRPDRALAGRSCDSEQVSAVRLPTNCAKRVSGTGSFIHQSGCRIDAFSDCTLFIRLIDSAGGLDLVPRKVDMAMRFDCHHAPLS